MIEGLKALFSILAAIVAWTAAIIVIAGIGVIGLTTIIIIVRISFELANTIMK